MASNEDILTAIAEIAERQKSHTESIQMLTIALTGSIDGKQKGLNQLQDENATAIQLLKDAEKARKVVTVAAITAAITGALSAIWAMLTGGGHG